MPQAFPYLCLLLPSLPPHTRTFTTSGIRSHRAKLHAVQYMQYMAALVQQGFWQLQAGPPKPERRAWQRCNLVPQT